MAIVTYTSTADGTLGDPAARVLYEVKVGLTGVYGWTVAGSGNGTTGGMDAVDRITSFSALVGSGTWVVLQSPHASPSDRIQILLSRTAVTNIRGAVAYDPQANFSGGGPATSPTSATAFDVTGTGANVSDNTRVRLTFTGDTATHWFAVMVTVSGAPTTPKWAVGVLPLTNQPAGAGKPYWVYAGVTGSAFSYQTIAYPGTSIVNGRGSAQWGLTAPSEAPGLLYYAQTTTITVPGTLQTSGDGEDINFPIVHALPNGRYFGVNAAAMWNGTARTSLTTMGDLSRIVFNDINLPWDGVTQPQS